MKGDIPMDHEERLELFHAVLNKYASVWEGHEAARNAAIASQEGGPGFVLYLRNFGSEEHENPAPGVERMYDLSAAELKKGVQAQVRSAGMSLLSLRGGSDPLDEMLGFAFPFFTGQLDNWRSIASELISAASAIVMVVSEMTPGLLDEVDLIRGMGRTSSSIVLVREAKTTLASLISDASNPAAIATLKSSFHDFNHVYGPPPRLGWRPGQDVDPALRDWPGLQCLSDLLAQAQPGKSALTAVRAAPCQVLYPRELTTPDHYAARHHMGALIRMIRGNLQSAGLKAPLEESVAEGGRDWEHLGLRLPHTAFGIAAALEDYDAMIESLAAIAEIYTYFLNEVMLGFIHAGYALELLRTRGASSFYEGLAPDAGPLGTYTRERIGVVYYALGRLRRAQGNPNDSQAAYIAAQRVLEPLDTPGGRRAMATTLHSHGGMLHTHGHHAEAVPMAKRAIELFEETDPNQFTERLGAAYHNLGSILTELGDPAGATEALNRALEIKKVALGTVRHTSVAETTALMGTIALRVGHASDARLLFLAAREMFLELAPDHPLLEAINDILGSAR
jgi:tetratricopeptide (TPR) repeat protein